MAKPLTKPQAKKTPARPAVKAGGKPVRKPTSTAAAKLASKVVAKADAAPAEAKPAKLKLVRDGFTMPAPEYAAFDALKQRALAQAHPVKKSELLRAGIKLLSRLDDAALLAALKDVPPIKTGRPKGKKGH